MKTPEIKAKYLNKNQLTKVIVKFKDGNIIITSIDDNQVLKKIPAYRIVQTGYKQKWFLFDKKAYFKTNDGLPTVFYFCRPKKLMQLIDLYAKRYKNKPPKFQKI